MYVCVCNALTEDDVRGCVVAGACSTKDVKESCGWKPGCGSCTKRLSTVISEARTAVELVDAMFGPPAGLELVSAEDHDTQPIEHAA